jgi:chromosome segregation ATPase
MEPIKGQRSAPSVQLLNEIDILLTQVRLAELYLKQAQAVAADQVARIQERYESQLEVLSAGISQKDRSLAESLARIAATEHLHLQIQDLQAESDKLRDEIAQKTPALQQQQSAARESEQLLQDQVRRLQDELAREQARESAKDSDLERARAEFQRRFHELEALLEETKRGHTALENDIVALRTELNDKDRLLAEGQAEFIALRQNIAQLEAAQRLAEEAANLRFETAHSSHEVELAQLRATLADREHAFAEREKEVKISVERHTAEIMGLRARLADGQSSLEQRTDELQDARSQIAALRERTAQLDLLQKQTERLLSVQAEQIRQRVRAELANLDACLTSKDHELQALRESAAEAQANLNATISDLRIQLLEKQRQLENTTGESADLKASVSGLSEQIARLVSAARDAESRGAAETERVRLEYQAELLDLREKLRGKQDALAEKEIRSSELERRLGTYISDLEAELATKQRLLEQREEALNTANSSAVALQESYTRLEASNREEQIGAAKEFEQVRRVLEAELAGLRNELQQKDRDLAQHQALVDHLAQGHKSEIQDLEAKLADLRHVAENRATELDHAKSEIQRLLGRIDQLESAAAHPKAMIPAEQITQFYQMQIAELRAEVERKNAELEEQGAARNDLVRTYRAELSRLRTEWQEKPMPLDNRNEDLLDEKNALETLRQGLTQLETAAAPDRERLLGEYEAQVATLRKKFNR